MKFEFSGHIFEKYSNIKFNENSSSGSRVIPCERTVGRTDGQTENRNDRYGEANSSVSQFFE